MPALCSQGGDPDSDEKTTLTVDSQACGFRAWTMATGGPARAQGYKVL
jgi:hypothetical protein